MHEAFRWNAWTIVSFGVTYDVFRWNTKKALQLKKNDLIYEREVELIAYVPEGHFVGSRFELRYATPRSIGTFRAVTIDTKRN